MVAVRCAHTLVAASSTKSRMNRCNTSSSTDTADGNTSTITSVGGHNRGGCHNGSGSCNRGHKVGLVTVGRSVMDLGLGDVDVMDCGVFKLFSSPVVKARTQFV